MNTLVNIVFYVLVVLVGLVMIAVGAAVGLLNALANAYVITTLWHWFVAPTFNLPELQILPTWGMLLILALLTYDVSKDEIPDTNNLTKEEKAKEFKKLLQRLAKVVLLKGFILLEGYVIYQLM